MDLKTLHDKLKACTITEAYADADKMVGMMIVNEALVIINDDGTPQDLIINMETLNLLSEVFDIMYDKQGNVLLESPAGYEDVFTKVGNFFYESMPCMFGVETGEQILKMRGKL